MPRRVLTKLRKVALSLPETHEVEAWGTPTFRVKNKLIAMWASRETHVGKENRDGVWIKATATNQQFMLTHAPKRFFFPPYVGKSGWIGVFLDVKTDWAEVASLLEDAYRMTAPKTLLKQLPRGSSGSRQLLVQKGLRNCSNSGFRSQLRTNSRLNLSVAEAVQESFPLRVTRTQESGTTLARNTAQASTVFELAADLRRLQTLDW